MVAGMCDPTGIGARDGSPTNLGLQGLAISRDRGQMTWIGISQSLAIRINIRTALIGELPRLQTSNKPNPKGRHRCVSLNRTERSSWRRPSHLDALFRDNRRFRARRCWSCRYWPRGRCWGGECSCQRCDRPGHQGTSWRDRGQCESCARRRFPCSAYRQGISDGMTAADAFAILSVQRRRRDTVGHDGPTRSFARLGS
jgi:hypothetical protein